MIPFKPPMPADEMERILDLADFDLDFTDLADNFDDLALLAAKIAGVPISLVNLIDSYTQWTIAKHGFEIVSMPKEDTICQFTTMGREAFEVNDLSKDDRFKNRDDVTGKDPALRYYLGIPLTTVEGRQIGSLCVLDTVSKATDPDKIALLTIVAREIVARLQTLRKLKMLREEVTAANELKKRIVHDIRGPLGGIVGLSQLIEDEREANEPKEVREYVGMIHQSASSLLELTNDILTAEPGKTQVRDELFNLSILKEKLESLYALQARNKNIALKINLEHGKEKTGFAKSKLLQITGNLITNAIKFTPSGGTVAVDLALTPGDMQNCLTITVKDSGIGLTASAIGAISNGTPLSMPGTEGEQGFGHGLALVRQLVERMQGTMHISSALGKGSVFAISLPQALVGTQETASV
jgi:signal transduction histidine kinase